MPQQHQPCSSTHPRQEASDKRCAKLIWHSLTWKANEPWQISGLSFRGKYLLPHSLFALYAFLQVFKYCFCCSYFVSTWVSAGASVCRNRGWGRSRVTWVTLGFCPIIGWSIWCGTVIHTATSQFLGWCCLTFLVYHRGSRSCDVPNHNQSRFWVDMSWFKETRKSWTSFYGQKITRLFENFLTNFWPCLRGFGGHCSGGPRQIHFEAFLFCNTLHYDARKECYDFKACKYGLFQAVWMPRHFNIFLHNDSWFIHCSVVAAIPSFVALRMWM